MKIALVIEAFDVARGGAEQWTWQFAQRLIAAGHEVHVAARHFAPSSAALALVQQRVLCDGGRTDFAAAAEDLLRPQRFDIIHDMGSGWYADLLQPHGGSRRASFEHNLLLLPRWQRSLKRAVAEWLPRYRDQRQLVARQYAAAAAPHGERLFVALSQRVARHFVEYHQVPHEQIRLVYNGVDVDRFSPARRIELRTQMRAELGIAPDETMLLIVAHNFRLKGVPTLLRAGERLTRQGHRVRVVVAGGKARAGNRPSAGRSSDGIVGSAASISGDGKPLWIGPVSDPRPLYAAADVYVQPTFYDPCSLVVLEALASGLPVVTSAFNGASELMVSGIHGDIVDDPSDERLLAEAIQPLLSPERREPMAVAARTLALEHTWEHNFQQIMAIYDELSLRRQADRRVSAA